MNAKNSGELLRYFFKTFTTNRETSTLLKFRVNCPCYWVIVRYEKIEMQLHIMQCTSDGLRSRTFMIHQQDKVDVLVHMLTLIHHVLSAPQMEILYLIERSRGYMLKEIYKKYHLVNSFIPLAPFKLPEPTHIRFLDWWISVPNFHRMFMNNPFAFFSNYRCTNLIY